MIHSTFTIVLLEDSITKNLKKSLIVYLRSSLILPSLRYLLIESTEDQSAAFLLVFLASCWRLLAYWLIFSSKRVQIYLPLQRQDLSPCFSSILIENHSFSLLSFLCSPWNCLFSSNLCAPSRFIVTLNPSIFWTWCLYRWHCEEQLPLVYCWSYWVFPLRFRCWSQSILSFVVIVSEICFLWLNLCWAYYWEIVWQAYCQKLVSSTLAYCWIL